MAFRFASKICVRDPNIVLETLKILVCPKTRLLRSNGYACIRFFDSFDSNSFRMAPMVQKKGTIITVGSEHVRQIGIHNARNRDCKFWQFALLIFVKNMNPIPILNTEITM